MSEYEESVTAEVSADDLVAFVDTLPELVLSSVLANMKHENEERIKRGDPPLAPLGDREANALQYGAQLAGTLLLRALQEFAEPDEEEQT